MNQHGRQNNVLIGIILAVITTIIWSGNYVVAKGIAKQLPPVSLAFYRWSIASIVMIPVGWRGFQREKQALLQHKKYLLWTALTGVTIFNTFIYVAGHYTSAINLALIGTTAAPLFVIILAALFLKEKPGLFRIIGMIICFSGILYLLSKGNWQQLAQFRFGKGDLLMLISAFSFAIYTIFVRKKPVTISPISFLFVIFIAGTLCLLPFYLLELYYSAPVHWTLNMIFILLYLGIGNSVIAFLCWNASIKRLGASGTALFGNLIPVFATIEAVLILGETFTIVHLISGILVIGGLIIANIKKN